MYLAPSGHVMMPEPSCLLLHLVILRPSLISLACSNAVISFCFTLRYCGLVSSLPIVTRRLGRALSNLNSSEARGEVVDVISSRLLLKVCVLEARTVSAKLLCCCSRSAELRLSLCSSISCMSRYVSVRFITELAYFN